MEDMLASVIQYGSRNVRLEERPLNVAVDNSYRRGILYDEIESCSSWPYERVAVYGDATVCLLFAVHQSFVSARIVR